MAEFISKPVGVVQGNMRPAWMPAPTNEFTDVAKVFALLKQIPVADGGRKETWSDPAKMPALNLDGGCPPELAAAILAFQVFWKDQGAITVADGVVDPRGHTINKLNSLVADMAADVGGLSNVAPEGQIDTGACWAASLAWMSRATPNVAVVSQLQIIGMNPVFATNGFISKNALITANAGGFLLSKKRGSVADLEATVRAGAFPLLVGFASGPMTGHVNIIHGFDPPTSQVDAMEPWYPDPSGNQSFDADQSTGMLIYTNKSTNAPFKFTGTHVRRPLSYYSGSPLEGEFILAVPSSLSFP